MANTTARMRRIEADWEQIRKDFAGHSNIVVTPIGGEPPEKYHVTYYVNGIYLLPDGRIETLGMHEVEITLHSDYPRYKPLCKILTPIWHPNFRDGQICIGDIWGAGESLSDIIINIGDMIQYKSWNSYSPLSADAAKWAMENKHLFPVGDVNLHIADYASANDVVDIDLFDENNNLIQEEPVYGASQVDPMYGAPQVDPIYGAPQAVAYGTAGMMQYDGNDFDITPEELYGIEYVPIEQRMQTVSHDGFVKGNKINFKTICVKGLLWALIGALLGFGISELTSDSLTGNAFASKVAGFSEYSEYYEAEAKKNKQFEKIDAAFKEYCEEEDLDPDDSDSMGEWIANADKDDKKIMDKYNDLCDKSEDILYEIMRDHDGDTDEILDEMAIVIRVSTALWAAILALFIGLFMGIGEGVYYGSKDQAIKYALIGAGVSLVLGYISGYVAQAMYAKMLDNDASTFTLAFVRGLGWAIMGLGIGVAIGLIKPEKRRILFCAVGGAVGAFIGGFLFNYICDIIPKDIVARGVAIVIMGALIGVGVGLLEQFAKQAWLKVIRGEFEGKEYLVFAGTTSIGNNSKNTIVLFKDKLVAPHHCDIILEGSRYTLVDQGSPMGTVVNGMKISRHLLRQGDAIAIGNSVLVFNTK